MRRFNFSARSILLFSAIVLLISSCSKDDTVNPDYVGTWSVDISESGLQLKDNLTFTKDGFTDIKQVNNPTTNIWVDYIKTTGTIAVAGSTMTTTYTGIGILTDFTVSITMYSAGSSNFQSLMSDKGMPLTLNSQFSVAGNKLTIMKDMNSNGNYTDPGETTVYTKQ